jgi:acylphosphatase
MGRKTLRLRMTGRVQGVGFRAFVADEAERRGLVGWVRNRADHSVEAVIAGEDKVVDDMVATCRRGPYGARVDNVTIEDASANDLGERSGFQILRTA